MRIALLRLRIALLRLRIVCSICLTRFVSGLSKVYTEGNAAAINKYSSVTDYIMSIVIMMRTFKSLSKENSEKFRITDVQEQRTAALEYVLTFVLPMFAFEFTKWESCILFAIYFLSLLILCSKHNLLFANMVFEVLNYRFYDVTVQNENSRSVKRAVISKRHLENMQEEDIYLRSMNNGFWFDVSNK